jgi:protein O-GlcNAc transferase
VEVAVYFFSASDGSELRLGIEREVSLHRDLTGVQHEEAARQMRLDGLQVLIDLNGHAAGSRIPLLALSPSQIIANFFGFPATVGGDVVDYAVVDRVVVPPSSGIDFSERLSYMPHSYYANDYSLHPLREALSPPTPDELYGARGRLLYYNSNHLYKLSPSIVTVWANMLRSPPHAALWLVQTHRFARDMVTREMRARGIPRRGGVWSMRVPTGAHIARSAAADLFLDTPRYNAHTVATDTLWAGVPILTAQGESLAARVAGSVTLALGGGVLAVETLKEYEDAGRRWSAT